MIFPDGSPIPYFSLALVMILCSGNNSAMQDAACNAGDTGSIPGSGRSPGGGKGTPLQCSCLGNPMDREAWWATVQGVTRVKHGLVTKPLAPSPRRRHWHPTPGLLPEKSHRRRSLVGCSPWGREESDTTERLHFHFSLSCTGKGNGNPLQCSCLENPSDGGAWWAALYGVAQSRTRLKPLSSSSSSIIQSELSKM